VQREVKYVRVRRQPESFDTHAINLSEKGEKKGMQKGKKNINTARTFLTGEFEETLSPNRVIFPGTWPVKYKILPNEPIS
jgi:hypothetical protein